MKQYILTEKELTELLYYSTLYHALSAGGVDNWTYYGESIKDALDELGYNSIDEVIENELLPNYKEI